MKKNLLTLSMAFICALSFAQDYGKYSLQHTSSEADLQQYVGQRVKVMDYKGHFSVYAGEGHDEYIFKYKFNGSVNTVYTIQKIKVGKQIVLDLISESGSKVKAKVNVNGAHDYKGMQSCKSFFLVDKFDADKQNLIGKTINNSEGLPVAKVVDVQMTEINNSYPQSRIVIQSDFDGSKMVCTEAESNRICSYFGRMLTHPKVKRQYKVVGIWMPESLKSYDSEYSLYMLQDPESPSDKYACKVSNPESSAFEDDLKGHYVSVLSKVEKPSNPAIRYGKTTVVNDKNVSKYSYVDNVIDILILGGSTQFDFILKNISDNSIKVIWNEAVFVGFDGTTSKIMHVGTKYSQREADQPATTIIKGAKIEDLAAPNCNVRYSDVLKEWVTDSMYPIDPATSPGQLRLMLPIQIKDVINEYVFVFDVNYVYDHPERLNLE
jgi:hypothetical protein